ncbi:hypothetical protein PDE_09485 [Penicillium oxalicum 114-2]|uniref:Uncharacterized protein n=1 Tax=Penicillium oxalicum (strain 114-2 / CGMCC 5302) TaxID=933388 RepID=S8A091_PENO1|nr:hypothetical protein PDE_09485 [Penicillium oxalicum 114-2]
MPSDRDSEDKNSDTNTNTSRDPPSENDLNPFVALRRFADEHVSAVLQSITGLPSTLSPPQTDRWTIFTDEETYESTKYRHRESDNDSRRPYETLTVDPYDLSVYDPFEQSPLGFPLPPVPNFHEEWEKQWPLNYIFFSAYSPTRLEKEARGETSHGDDTFSSLIPSSRNPKEPQWREAFEDLLRLENGLPLLDHSRIIAGRSENNEQWLRGVLKRESMGPRFKNALVHGNDGDLTIEVRTRVKIPVIELELTEEEEIMQEKFMRDIDELRRKDPLLSESQILRIMVERYFEPPPGLEEARQDNDPHARDPKDLWLDQIQELDERLRAYHFVATRKTGDNEPSRVVSTSSRTEQTHYPDGMFSSRRVVTKQYADGREETDSFDETSLPHSDDGWDEVNSENSEKPKSKSKGGWFWSS